MTILLLQTNQVPGDELNYVKENGVHFKRYEPKDKNLQFNRFSGNVDMIDKILSPKELINKIEAKNMEKMKGNDDKNVYNNKPNVIEDDLEPNGNEVDYKEMGDH
uniref:Uncharacterized protein n=1 Tax=Strongyloides papillosus TaxID=174720 RepID=A0A0N5C4E0_STREA